MIYTRLFTLPLLLLLTAWIGIHTLGGSVGVTAPSILDSAASTENEDCDPCASASFTVSSGADKLIVVLAFEDPNGDTVVSGVDWNTSEALTLGCEAIDPTSQLNGTEIWYLDSPTATTATVSVNMSESTADFVMTVVTLQDAASGAPSDTDTYGSDSDNTVTLSLTVAATDFVIIGASMNDAVSPADDSWTPGAGQTELVDLAFADPSDAGGEFTASWEVGESAPSATSSTSAGRFAACGVVIGGV